MVSRQKGTDQIIVGLDDPYPLGEMESEAQSSYPGKLLDLAVDEKIITATQHKEMWCDNVVKWLCGNDTCDFMERITKNKTKV
jgi:aminocarboxymuconate-semialdehyde decarboxylase